MTGYKTPRYRLEFPDRPGLEVVMRGLPVGQVFATAGLADQFKAGQLTSEAVQPLFALLASRIVSWNIEGDDDEPVPATPDGVASLDMVLFGEILTAWLEHMMAPPKASPTPSANGHMPPLPEVSLPMAPMSVSPGN